MHLGLHFRYDVCAHHDVTVDDSKELATSTSEKSHQPGTVEAPPWRLKCIEAPCNRNDKTTDLGRR
jgi:hypothetical protein